MDLHQDWDLIKSEFATALNASRHCAIGSVGADGNPHITPIGFVFMRDDKTLFYFEQYSKNLPLNYQTNRNVCVMVVNSAPSFWLSALVKGRFASFPGLRLYGEVGEARQASAEELEALRQRIGPLKFLSGARKIWSGLETVRDIRLHGVEPVRYPRMMEHLL